MRQSRAALLSTCGDPFILLFGVKLWQQRWHNEIDKLYINFNNHVGVSPEVVAECFAELVKDPRIVFVYHATGIGNGLPQVELLKLVTEDLVLLLEDDFYIFRPHFVDAQFRRIESGETDILGSPRGSCGKEVWEAAQKKYNLDYSGLGDKGPTWWPTGFYCKRKDLLKTDLDFGSKEYKAGEYFEEIDHTFQQTEYSDTFAWASLQLRYLNLRSIDIPQFHASPEEIEYYEQKSNKWEPGTEIGWIHAGSLSAGWGGYLLGRLPDTSTLQAKMEIETRCAFWKIAMDEVKGFEDFKKEYTKGLINLTEQARLSTERIQKKINIYRNLLQI